MEYGMNLSVSVDNMEPDKIRTLVGELIDNGFVPDHVEKKDDDIIQYFSAK